MSNKERLNKVMAARGLCSRREADDLISRGHVWVEGRPAEMGERVPHDARIEISAKAQRHLDQQITILIHKPVGYVSGQPEPDSIPAVRLITPESHWPEPLPQIQFGHLQGLAPAGRLDIDSTGLLVLTQDGVLARRLIGAETEIEKEYLVRVEGPRSKDILEKLRFGLSLDGKPLKQAQVEELNEDQLRFVLREGRKRQIRRMCEMVGLRVTGLKRVRIGRLKLGKLPKGRWMYLDKNFEI